MSVEIDASLIPTGNYEIEGQVFDAKSGKMKACLQISASVGYWGYVLLFPTEIILDSVDFKHSENQKENFHLSSLYS